MPLGQRRPPVVQKTAPAEPIGTPKHKPLQGWLASGCVALLIAPMLLASFDVGATGGRSKAGKSSIERSASGTYAPETFALAPLSVGHPQLAAAMVVRPPITPETTRGPGGSIALPGLKTKAARLERGDTLSGLLARSGVDNADAFAVIEALRTVYKPRDLRAGQVFTLTFQPSAEKNKPAALISVSLRPDVRHDVTVNREDEGFKARKDARPLTTQTLRREGVIESSLFLDGEKAGVPAAILVEMIRLFSWDVDFQRSIQSGDQFEVLFETVTDEDGLRVDEGRVLYASLTLSGDKLSLYRFEDTADGRPEYFDDQGKGAKKGLMRTPINGARLSSGFGLRHHPILGYSKMHKGTDFAAPQGTPIYAAGDGTVDYAGRKGAYGNFIRISHVSGYSTAYAHMKSFARGMRKGRHVEQGQVIGYVGTTGRSTGPHLHFEIMVNGRQVNPMTVKMPSGRTLDGKELARFEKTRAATRQLWANLATTKPVAKK
ncbi:MAG: M23 family metallopeptidase [Rhodospirillales bacterium]